MAITVVRLCRLRPDYKKPEHPLEYKYVKFDATGMDHWEWYATYDAIRKQGIADGWPESDSYNE